MFKRKIHNLGGDRWLRFEFKFAPPLNSSIRPPLQWLRKISMKLEWLPSNGLKNYNFQLLTKTIINQLIYNKYNVIPTRIYDMCVFFDNLNSLFSRTVNRRAKLGRLMNHFNSVKSKRLFVKKFILNSRSKKLISFDLRLLKLIFTF